MATFEEQKNPEHSASPKLPWWSSSAVGALLAATALDPVLTSERGHLLPGHGFWLFGLLACAGAVPVVLLFALIRRRRRVIRHATPFLAAGVLIFVGLVIAEPLHWTRTESSLLEVLDGADAPRCSFREPCRIGWWDFVRIDLAPELPTAWTADNGCYAGRGFARMAPDQTLSDAETVLADRYDRLGYVSIREWYDGWVEICVTT